MTTVETLKSMSPEELRAASAKIAKTLAKRIAIGIVVTVVVTLTANALVGVIENAFDKSE